MERDWADIRRRSELTAGPMRDEFERIRGELRDIAEFVYPPGVRGLSERHENVHDRAEERAGKELLTAMQFDALRKGAAGFLTNLMSPARKWFKLRAAGGAEGEGGGAGTETSIVEELGDAVLLVMQRSGSYKAFKKIFEHLLAFGFACAVVTEDERRVCRAECLRVGTYCMGVGRDGGVERVERTLVMTAEEIVREFGGGEAGREALPERVLEAWRRGDPRAGRFLVRNLIEPNRVMFKPGTDEPINYGVPSGMRYRSVYWLDGVGSGEKRAGILGVRGFRFCPIVAPRLDCEPGGIYGRGRGADALNLCRGLQGLRYDALEISSNRAEPPLIAAAELKEEGLDLGRGGVTYANIGEARSMMVQPILPNPPTTDETYRIMDDFKQEIRSCFFNGEFATIDSLKEQNRGVRTATEVDALVRENMMLLSGVVLMMDDELLNPMVEVFTRYVAEKVPDFAEVDVEAMKVEYESNLHLAQKTQEIQSEIASLDFVAKVMQVYASVGDNFRLDHIVRKVHRLYGGSETDLEEERKVERARAERAQAQQEAQGMEMEAKRAEIDAMRAKSASAMAKAQPPPSPPVLGTLADALGGF